MIAPRFEADCEIWWQWITGSRRLTHHMLWALRARQHVFLDTTGGLPWPATLRELVRDQLQTDRLYIEELDGAACAAWREIGKELIELYAARDVAMAYRGANANQAAQFLRQHDILQGKVIWVRGLDAQTLGPWLAFGRIWKPGGMGGLFVLEGEAGPAGRQLPGHIALCGLRDFVTTYDMQVFCGLLAAQLEGPDRWKRYVSLAAAELWPRNPQAAADFIGAIASAEDDAAALAESLTAEPHDIARALWQAQLQTAFPLIEELQSQYTQAYYTQIEAALKAAGPDAYRFGQPVTDPFDAEFGLLARLAGLRGENGKLLYLPHDDYHKLHFLRDRRNELAHMICCAPADLARLFADDLAPSGPDYGA